MIQQLTYDYMEKIMVSNKPCLPKQWRVVYTRSKWEKKADKLLKDQGVTSFCPLIKTRRKWADRNKLVELPLFNSYLFVYVTAAEQLKVQQTPGILNFVHHCNRPVIISDSEIDRIKTIVNTYSDIRAVANLNFSVGDKIKINDGPLLDCQGEVVQVQGASVIMVMEKLGCALIVKVSQDKVSKSADHKALAMA